jgi:hypothetical protein
MGSPDLANTEGYRAADSAHLIDPTPTPHVPRLLPEPPGNDRVSIEG